jgi:hypothetical protein
VQAHHAQHPLALVVDGNEGYGAGRIVVDDAAVRHGNGRID